jgi:energy-coupling factor transporter ATP-binding protein EcfA2
VLPDEAGQLQFHDWGRYEEFLGQSRSVIKTLQHPSLISFVGPTGAGKSTIVKALIRDFDSSEGVQQLQTPVVGLAKHRAIPTSGEVHLYWDHISLYGPRPLLFADCEGLGGGSLAPASERAVSAKQHWKDLTPREGRRGSKQDRGSSPESPSKSGRQSPSFRPPVFRVHSPPASPRAQTGPRPPSNLFLHTDSTTEYYSSPPAHGYSPYSPIEQPDQAENGWTSGCDKNQRGFTRPITWATGQNRNRQFIVENLYPRLLYTFSDVIVHVMRNVKCVRSTGN